MSSSSDQDLIVIGGGKGPLYDRRLHQLVRQGGTWVALLERLAVLSCFMAPPLGRIRAASRTISSLSLRARSSTGIAQHEDRQGLNQGNVMPKRLAMSASISVPKTKARAPVTVSLTDSRPGSFDHRSSSRARAR